MAAETLLFSAGQKNQEAHVCPSCSAVTACSLGHLMVVCSLASIFFSGFALVFQLECQFYTL